ncbi:Ribokinase-like protein [Microthyrium microscopicum]|uniref:Ribokinase-like protein n=1 Tax=Microthyrium microscopicum TaxID=703497 RepID=A0A6A6UER9_9PEZI|nr:Ribokinase-like protein [Microthyrium microscopicum]
MPLPTIALVGAIYIDTILTVPYYPSEDDKLRATTQHIRRGGNVGNSAEVLAQLHKSPPSVVAPISTQNPGDYPMIRESLPGVELWGIDRKDTETPRSYIIRSKETGSRTIVSLNNMGELQLDEFVRVAEEKGEGVMWWHFEGRNNPEGLYEILSWLRRAKGRDVVISLECEKPERRGLHACKALADVLFYSKTWAVFYMKEWRAAGAKIGGWSGNCKAQQLGAFLDLEAAEVRKLKSECTKYLFGTFSEGGSAVYNLKGSDEEEQKHHVPEVWTPDGGVVVDTIGAGDVFIAAVIAGMLERSKDDLTVPWEQLQDVLRNANKIAGAKVCQEGFAELLKKCEEGYWTTWYRDEGEF